MIAKKKSNCKKWGRGAGGGGRSALLHKLHYRLFSGSAQKGEAVPKTRKIQKIPLQKLFLFFLMLQICSLEISTLTRTGSKKCFLWVFWEFSNSWESFSTWIARKTNKRNFHILQHYVKSVRIRSYSDPYFPAFGMNTQIYEESLRIQYESGKVQTRITPNTDTFHAVQLCRKLYQVPWCFPRSSLFKYLEKLPYNCSCRLTVYRLHCY